MRYIFVILAILLVSASAAQAALLLVPSQYPTIQAAVDAATTGDTIIVSPGVYLVDEIHITKGVTLRGQNIDTCIIDGQLDPSIPFGTVYIDNPTGPVTVEGFTLRNSGFNSQGYYVLLSARFITQPVIVRNCHFIGHGNVNDGDVGAYVDESSGNGTFTIVNNEFEDMWQAILLEITRAGGSVCQNDIHDLLPHDDGVTLTEPEGIFALTYTTLSNGDVPNPILIDSNSIHDFAGLCVIVGGGYLDLYPGKFTDVTISNNNFEAIGSGPERRHGGIEIINYGATPAHAAVCGVENCQILGNNLIGDGLTGIGGASYGVRIWGPNNNPVVSGNKITDNDFGIAIEEKVVGAGYATGVVAHYNNITGNVVGFQNDSPTSADAENNWWGAADGPGPTGSGDPVSANVDFTPWLTEPSVRVVAEMELLGVTAQHARRDITFTLTTAAPVTTTTITQPVCFYQGVGSTVLYGFADTIDNICISAKDRQHTLVQKIPLVDPGTREFLAWFRVADALVGGDITNNNVDDIWDYGVLAAQFGTAGHPYAWPLWDADLDCSGTVDKNDFAILYTNYLKKGDLWCNQNYKNTPVAVTSILCSQLAPFVGGLTNARKGDLNRDYKLNGTDVSMFAAKYGITLPR